MAEESYGFDNARTRLEEIVTQVRKKEVSLEKSLDLLEEGVRLANQCVEQIDHADWDSAAGVVGETTDSDTAMQADTPAVTDSADDGTAGAGPSDVEDAGTAAE
jgi:exodeoxyribonuclease VII small subunit